MSTARKSLFCKPDLGVFFWKTPSASNGVVNNLGQMGEQKFWNSSSKRIELLLEGGQRCSRFFFARSTNVGQQLLPPGQSQWDVLVSWGDWLSSSESGGCWWSGLRAQNYHQPAGATERNLQLHGGATAHALRRAPAVPLLKGPCHPRRFSWATSHSQGLTSDSSHVYSNCSGQILSIPYCQSLL